MGLASEYFDDGSSFLAIDPLSINPDALTNFSLFERYPPKNGIYRFRCLLMDTSSIDRARLLDLLKRWEQIFIHKDEARKYKAYIKDNLEFILNHDDIAPKQKTDTLITLSTDVVQDSFAVNFSSTADSGQIVKNVEKLIEKAMNFISSIESLNGLASLIGHDYETHTHSIKVGWLTATFINSNRDLFDVGSRAELKELMIQAAVAGFLHDLGKVKIPQNVINKPGRLNNLEYIIMQSHTAYAASLLFESGLPRDSMQTILYHHENDDGSGYPCGLSGENIPLVARICHIADAFDALTSERPYKKAKTPYEALTIMAGENPYLETLQKFEAEAAENIKPPVVAIVRDDYEAKLKRLREKEMVEAEAQKRVEARMKLRDKGMSHCFDRNLLRRFILTINKSESFDLSGLL
ncbi:MAG TPA: metal-dependent phosphohydrolase [Desulfobacteraceae bacterium]|nr:metal-dependent phosphohydrolase [Desulfobacteraceae bacterium]|tara:strand:- start:1417 stop:2643 length:1227 start_codon:yes stop_codon:yes gene_type:complete